jgi:hypothetical protein
MDGERNFVGLISWKRPLGKPRRQWKGKIMDQGDGL